MTKRLPPSSPPPFWQQMANYQRVGLRGLCVDMSVGVHEEERRKKQRVIVDVDLFGEKDRHTGTAVSDCIDYDAVRRYILSDWPHRPHTNLLETLAEELVSRCFEDRRVAACRVVLKKPDVYPDSTVPEVEFFRRRPGN